MRANIRILVAVFTIILLGMSATAVYEYMGQKRTLKQIALRRDAVTISSVSVNLQNSIVASRNLLQSYIELLPVSEALDESLPEAEKHVARERILSLMARINSFSKIDVSLLLLNRHGDILATSRPEATSNRSGRDFFRRAVSGESVLCGPFVALDINEPVYAIAEPVRDSQGQIAGVFSVFVPLPSLKDDLNALLPQDEASRILLVSRQGKIIFNSGGDEDEVPEKFYHDWLAQVMAADRGSLELPGGEAPAMLSFAHDANLGWRIVVISDMSGMLEQAARNRNRIIAANAFGFVFIFAAIVAAARNTSRTLRNCIDIARAGLSENETSLKTMPHNDDLAALEEALQTLVGELARRRGEMEELARERASALQSTEQRLKILLSSMPDAVLSVNTAGEINFANQAACKMLGYKEEELAGRMNWRDIYRNAEQEGQSAAAAGLDENLRGRVDPSIHVDMWLRRADGGRFLADLVSMPMYKDGAAIGFSLLFKDVTELREAQRKMEAIYRASSGINMITVGSDVVECSESCKEMLKIESAAEFMKDWRVFVPEFQPNGAPSLAEIDRHEELARKNGFERFEWMFRDSGGALIPCEVTLTPITHEGRDALMSIIRDLSAIKKSETALNKERLQLQRILDSAPAGVFVISMDHIVRFANPAFIRQVRSTVGESVESGFINEEDLGIIVSHVIREGIIHNHNTQMIAPGGGIRNMLITATWVVYDGESSIMGWLTDITEIKKYEKNLMLAKEQAEEATRAKGDFLARMSHEIRTPMNAIIGLGYLLKKTELAPRQLDFLNKIQRAADNLLGIIDDILDFSKIEANKMTIDYRAFKLSTILKDLQTLFAYRAEQKGLEFLFRISLDVPDDLLGDSLRISQILNNLCSNAIKFTEKGQIVVSIFPDKAPGLEPPGIKGAAGKDKGITLHIAVDDTGIGLSEDQAAKLFSSFTQADGSITRKYGGTGLGLAICKRLAELMGGKIWVVSSAGKGSTFHVLLRLGLLDEKERPAGLALRDLKQLRVLIVDDNAMAREILEEIMVSFGIVPLGVGSGEEALRALAQATAAGEPYHLVLLDWKMPGLDGLQTARLIKERQEIITPPQILMVSAHDCGECVRQAEGLGLKHFLNKPVMPSTMLEAIYQALQGVEADDGAQGPSDQEDRIGQLRAMARGARVLLAEDNDINQNIAVDILSQLEVKIDVAETGREAVDMFNKNEYDLVFMDIQMPEMGGLEAARLIRSGDRPAARRIPIIAMTANAMEGDYEKSIEAGMNGHITKPLDPELLLETVGKWVKGPGMQS